MSDTDGLKTGVLVELFFEWKQAEHQVEEPSHFWDATLVPCPDLGANVVKELELWMGGAQRFCEAQIESRVIDKNDGIRLEPSDFAAHPFKLVFEIGVIAQDIPEADHGVIGPFEERLGTQRPHLCAAGAVKHGVR